MRKMLLAVALLSGCGANAITVAAEGDSSFEVAHARALEQVDIARQRALTAAASHGTAALHAETARWRPLAELSNTLRDAEVLYTDALDAQRRHGTPLDPSLLPRAEQLFADLVAMAQSLGVRL
jgi:hypothetical protein